MTIYLHIGTHKTGTTSIQRYLSQNRDALAAQGIWYPRISELLAGKRDSTSHLNIARSLDTNNKPKTYSKEELSLIFKTLTTKSKYFNSTIISAEAFWRIGFTKPPEEKYDIEEYNDITWKSKAKNIKYIQQLLGDISKTSIVATLRERSAYIQSSYSEFILATQYKKNIHKFINYIQHVSDYKRQLKAWRECFPILTLSYEKMRDQGNLPVEFIRSVAGPFEATQNQDKPQKLFNPGHPIPCVIFKRYLNSLVHLSTENRNRIYDKGHRRFRRSAEKGIPKALQSINSWLTIEEICSLRRKFSEDDNFIRTTFCKDFVTGGTTKQTFRESNIVPITKRDEYLCLGWMLSKQQPAYEWFSNPSQ